MHLTLLVPELIWPEPADQFALGKLSAPGLEWLLAHATCERHPRRAFEASLATSFGLADAPFGALRLLGEGDDAARGGHWLCADPVHLRFHRERIVLADAGAFDLDKAEADTLAAALNDAFADIGEFRVAETRRWYLRLNTTVDHPVAPLSAVAGRRVDSNLNGNALPLTRWLNEVQMFLHGHPVNEQRQAAGKPAINSLWLWGGGKLGDTPAAGFSGVWSDNPLAAGLALAGNTPLHTLPASLAAFLPAAGHAPLLVLDSLLPRVLYEDGEGWRGTLERLDADYFQPLQKALGGKVDRVTLIAPTIYGELRYTLRAGERWKFWKRSQPLAALANQLAEPAQP